MMRRLFHVFVVVLCAAGLGVTILTSVSIRSVLRQASERSRFTIRTFEGGAVLVDKAKGDSWILECSGTSADLLWIPLQAFPNGFVAQSTEPDKLAANPGGPVARTGEIRSILEASGYARIELKRTALGYFVVAARVRGVDVTLIVDTGAPTTRLDKNRLEPGAGAQSPVSIQLGGFRTREVRIEAFDLTELNKRLTKSFGAPPVDGVLGADILDAHLAVVNAADCELYLLRRGG